MDAISPSLRALQHFSTEERGDLQAAALFEEKLRTLFAVDLALNTASSRQLSAQMAAYRGRNLRFAALRFSPHSTGSAGCLRRPDSRLLVSLHKAGHAVVSQGGRESSIEPGQIFVIDPSLPFQITTGEIETQSIYLTRSALVALVPELDDLTALAITCDSGPGAILRGALEAMFRSAGSLDEDSADRIADAMPYLIAPALMALRRGKAAIPSRLRQMHTQQIRRFVRDHLGDASLSATSIAEGVNLSPRHVYELFSEEPEPLMKWVWSERLDRCRRDLAEVRLRLRTIGEIAYAWGFSDVSHFSRAFKLKFGVSPRQYRCEALTQDPVDLSGEEDAAAACCV